jgi:hypothetical protein
MGRAEVVMSHRVLAVLTFINLAGLVAAVGALRPARADAVPDVVRAKALEIVDGQGRVRARIAVLPPSVSRDGVRSAETVLLRLITERGRPSVKIGASEETSGMSLTGPTGTKDSYIVLESNGTDSSIRVRNEAGREQLVRP